MKQEFYQGMPYVELAITAMLVFLGLFIAAIVRVRRTPNDRIDTLAHLPLNDADEREARS